MPELASCAVCIALAGSRLYVNINIGIHVYTHGINVYIIRVAHRHMWEQTHLHINSIYSCRYAVLDIY